MVKEEQKNKIKITIKAYFLYIYIYIYIHAQETRKPCLFGEYLKIYNIIKCF
jgi:hypothetical protein